MHRLPEYQLITKRLKERRQFIYVLMGPRQVGKSTTVKQVLEDIAVPYQLFTADNVPASDDKWVSNCWETVRNRLSSGGLESIILVIDEIQKIRNWSEVVKKEWDADTYHNRNIKVLLLGSSRVMLYRGLSESLAGRFEEIRMTHWGYADMHDAFGFNLAQYLFYGGYPGPASFINDPDRYYQYVQSAIVESALHRDVLMDTPVSKPALLRQTFELGAAYSGQLLSLTKMVAALQDAGNTSTLANYLTLLDECGMLCGLSKYSVDTTRRKASIPKLQVYNNALKTLYCPLALEQALLDRRLWGHIYESGIGAWIVSQAFVHRFQVFYWRERNDEVDYVLRRKGSVVAIEVKSNAAKNTAGLAKFRKIFNPTNVLIIGDEGIPAEEFLTWDIRQLF